MAETTVAVPCMTCGRDIKRTPREWQDLADLDAPPVCKVCEGRTEASPVVPAPAPPIPLTANDCVLIALSRIHRERIHASTSEIVVAAWSVDKMKFGLPGFEALYPNSNRVIVALVVLTRRKMIERMSPSRYRLTEKGRGSLRAG